MDLRTRFIGMLLFACGLALCYGAVELWSPATLDASSGPGVAGNVLRLAGACIVAVFGVGNVAAGLVVALRRTARD